MRVPVIVVNTGNGMEERVYKGFCSPTFLQISCIHCPVQVCCEPSHHFYLYRLSFDMFYYSLNMRVCLFRCPLCQDRPQKSDVQKYQKVGIFFFRWVREKASSPQWVFAWQLPNSVSTGKSFKWTRKSLIACYFSLWFPVVFGEDFRLADISLVKDGSGFQGPTLDPAASVLPLSLPGHALWDAGPDTNLPVFRDVLLLLAAGSVKFD